MVLRGEVGGSVGWLCIDSTYILVFAMPSCVSWATVEEGNWACMLGGLWEHFLLYIQKSFIDYTWALGWCMKRHVHILKLTRLNTGSTLVTFDNMLQSD